MTLPDIKFQTNFTERPFAGKRRASDGTVMLDVNLTDKDIIIPDGVQILGYRSSDGSSQPLRLDKATNSIQTIEYEHHEIHAGSHFFVAGVQDLSINEVLDFTWQMPNTTKWIHWTWKIDTQAETAWYIYENVIATNPLANAITPFNSNRNILTGSGTTMKYELQANLAAANGDTNVAGATLLESGISGGGKTAGNDVRSNELILKQGALYCLRAVATAAGYIDFIMNWYEHTDIG